MAGQTNHVIDTILERIDTGVYLPGAVLDEQSLARELALSRTPVREAFIRLEATGLIVREARRGAHVFKPSTDEFLRILEVHAQLEAQAAALAARRITEDQRAALAANIDASADHLARHGDGEHATYYRLNMAFHEVIMDAAHNPYLSNLIKTNARMLMSYYRNRYRFEGATAASVEEHRQIADLILSGQSEAAHAAMAAHFAYDLDTVMDLLAAVS